MANYAPGAFLYEEITNQAQAWAKAIPTVTAQANAVQELFSGVEEVIFTGCGSGWNASLCAAAAFQIQTGISARAVPAAENYLFPRATLLERRKTLAVLISRSGKTTEVVHALDFLRGRGIPTLGITCTSDSPLASKSDLSLVLGFISEQAVATTVSLTGMTLTALLLAGIVSADEAYINELSRLPEVCQSQMENYHSIGQKIGQRTDLTRYAFVGSGPLFGLAHEAQLKVKEMVLLPADAYPVLEFRHGPQSNVDAQMLITVLMSDSASEEEARFVQDMQALGGIIWVLCDQASAKWQEQARYVLELRSGLGELARGLLYMPAIQYMAYYRALSQGLNPDKPRHLSYWVDTSR